MDAKEIDAAIRARIAELENSNEHIERDALLCNHLPTVANRFTWDKVVDYVTQLCDNPGGGCDGRPGRLYEISDEAIVEAEAWFADTERWQDMMDSSPIGEYPAEWFPGQTIQVKHNYSNVTFTVLTSAYSYMSAAYIR